MTWLDGLMQEADQLLVSGKVKEARQLYHDGTSQCLGTVFDEQMLSTLLKRFDDLSDRITKLEEKQAADKKMMDDEKERLTKMAMESGKQAELEVKRRQLQIPFPADLDILFLLLGLLHENCLVSSSSSSTSTITTTTTTTTHTSSSSSSSSSSSLTCWCSTVTGEKDARGGVESQQSRGRG
eukprot:765469-Hanusia_phi.AAC.3